jgi:putative endonuclease
VIVPRSSAAMLSGMRTAAQRAGDAAEDAVASRLQAAGWTVLGRNVRVGRGELDIVAIDPGRPAELVVVEVRYRRRRDFGLPEETFPGVKARRVLAAALGLRATGILPDGRPLPRLPLRIDLVVVEPGPGARLAVRHHRGVA